MNRVPRNPKEKLVDKYILIRTLYASVIFTALTFGIFALFYRTVDLGLADDMRFAHARALAINMLVMGSSLFYLFNCKRMTGSVIGKDFFKNKVLLVVAAILIVMQIGFTYLSFMQSVFSVAPLKGG